jgi:hypothetical protein
MLVHLPAEHSADAVREGDLIMGSGNQSAIGTLVERQAGS